MDVTSTKARSSSLDHLRPERWLIAISSGHVALICVVASLTLTWPLAANLGSALPANLADPLLNAIILAWNVQWVTGARRGGFWDAPIFHPEQDALAYSEHLIGETLLVWPVFALTSNAILTYNVAFVASFVLAGVCTYVLLRSLTGRRDVALVFALAFAFSPFRVGAQVARLQMLMTGWLPLALWAIHRYGDTAKRRYLGLLATSLTLLVLSNMYMLFLAAPAIVLLTAYAAVRSPHRRWQIARGFAGTIALVAALLVPAIAPYRDLNQEMPLRHDEQHVADYSAHLTSYGSAHARTAWLPWVANENTGDQALYPGMLLLLPLVLIINPWRRRSCGGQARLVLVYACVGVLAAWLSFGPELRTADGDSLASSPYAWLQTAVPGLAAVRAPGRFAVVVCLALAVIGAVVTAGLTSRLRQRTRAVLMAAALAVIGLEALSVRPTVEPIAPDGRPIDRELYGWLARQPASALLELPASRVDAQLPNAELFYQLATLQHPHALVNGYSGFNPPLANWLEHRDSPFMDPARLDEGVALLRAIGVRFLVIHAHDYAFPGEAARLAEKARTLPDVTAEHRFHGGHVFELRAN